VKRPRANPYLVKSVVHASRLPVGVFVRRARRCRCATSRPGAVCRKAWRFRLLYTLERVRHGRQGRRETSIAVRCVRSNRNFYRLGYAAQGTDYTFSKEVSLSLERAAAAEGVELISLDNRYNPKIAQRNADILVREKVDLVIEFPDRRATSRQLSAPSTARRTFR